jgi:DNA invertase Pin-like site-specific DNA recombinase
VTVPSNPDEQEQRPIPVVLYGSRSEPDERGSIPDQIEAARGKVVREGGRVVMGEFEDNGFSGYSKSRGPDLQAAMNLAAQLGRPDVWAELWGWHPNRFARGNGTGKTGARSLTEMFTWARRNYVNLRTVHYDVLREPAMVGIMDMLAHGESETKAINVKVGMRRAVVKDGTHVGRVPYGYRKNRDAPGGLVPDPVTAPILRGIVAASLRGESMHAISRQLNRDGIPTMTDRRWRGGTVRNVFRTLAYVGRQVCDGREYEGKWEPLISDEDYATVQALLAARATTSGGHGGRHPSADFLFFGGHLHCECGATMVPRSNNDTRNGTRYAVYECSGRRADVESCSMLPIRKEQIDGPVLDYLMRRGIDLEATAAEMKRGDTLRLAEAQAYAVRTAQERERVAGRLQRAREGYLDGTLEGPEYTQVRDELTVELAALADQAEHMEARHAEAIAAADTSDAQEDLLRWLATAREAISSLLHTADAEGASNVRASLLLLFECFRLRRLGDDSLDPDWMPEGRGWERDLLIPGGLYIEPVIRPNARLAADPMPFPQVHRVPLHLAPNNEEVRFRT